MAGNAAFKGLPSQAKPAPLDIPPLAQATNVPSLTPTLASGPTLSGPLPAGGIPVSGTPPSSKPEPVPPEVAAAAEEKAKAPPGTIFGEDLISEKSLDEVILSYLAEDLADSE